MGKKTVNALMDTFPEGTVMCMTIVVQPQDTLGGPFHPAVEKMRWVRTRNPSGRVRT